MHTDAHKHTHTITTSPHKSRHIKERKMTSKMEQKIQLSTSEFTAAPRVMQRTHFQVYTNIYAYTNTYTYTCILGHTNALAVMRHFWVILKRIQKDNNLLILLTVSSVL